MNLNDSRRMRAITRVRSVREDLGMSAAELGEELQVSASTIHRWESFSDTASPNARQIMAFILKFDVSPLWMMTGEGPRSLADLLAIIEVYRSGQMLKEIAAFNDTADQELERMKARLLGADEAVEKIANLGRSMRSADGRGRELLDSLEGQVHQGSEILEEMLVIRDKMRKLVE